MRYRCLNENRRKDWNADFVEQYSEIETPEEVAQCIMDALQGTPAMEALANAISINLDPRVAFSTKTAKLLMDEIAEEALRIYEENYE